MHVYLGRQPILDRRLNVAAYELLFRSSLANFCDSMDDVSGTSQVMVNALLGVGLDRLLGGKPAFISFDRTLLLGDWSALFAPDKIVIEILDTVHPDQEILFACHKLRQHGYALALHYRMDDGRTEAFAPFLDILKVDFRQTSPADQERIVRHYRKRHLRMVAGKVETEEEFQRASQLGYDYFQGFFFASPTVLKTTCAPASQTSCLRLVKEMQKAEMDFDAVEKVIGHDISFSHLLLKYLHSAAFHWDSHIESIRQGLILLGEDKTRQWVWMASLSSLAQDRPSVLMSQVLMRGRFCEAIALSAKLPLRDSDPFLLGMFSLLDAILQRPLQGILDELNIGQGIRNALLGAGTEADTLTLLLQIVKSYEVGDWQLVESAARAVGISGEALSTCYLESLSWVDTVFSPDEPTGAGSLQPISFHRDPATHTGFAGPEPQGPRQGSVSRFSATRSGARSGAVVLQ